MKCLYAFDCFHHLWILCHDMSEKAKDYANHYYDFNTNKMRKFYRKTEIAATKGDPIKTC